MSGAPDSVALFEFLADQMNDQPDRYDGLGDVDMELGVEMTRDGQESFRVLLSFHGIRCEAVREASAADLASADCFLRGDVGTWRVMFDDIATHRHATGPWTINSLTLMGDRMTVTGDDPLGVDRFFRFNQTLQSFFDGYANERQPQ